MFRNLIARLFRSRRGSEIDGTEGSKRAESGPPEPQENKIALETLADPVDALAIELGRARRYEHALSIVVAAPHTLAGNGGGRSAGNGRERYRPSSGRGPAATDVRGADGHEAAILARNIGVPPQEALACLTAAGLREILRTSDVVCYDSAEGHFVLGLTESDAATARRAVSRIRSLFQERLGVDLRTGVAQFPADGLTLEDLLSTAREAAERIEEVDGGVRLQNGAESFHRVRSDVSGRRRARPARSVGSASADSRVAGGGE